MSEKKFRLLDLSVDEVSLVADPANDQARVLITKAAQGMKCPDCGAMNKEGAVKCAKCGYDMKKAAKPEGDNMADLEKDLKAAEDLAAEEQTKRISAEAEVTKLKAEVAELKKAADTPEVIEKRKLEALPAEFRKRLETAEAAILKSNEREADQVAFTKVKESFGNLKGKTEDTAKLYRKATSSMTEDEVKALDELLKSASEAMKANLFSERGRPDAREGGDPVAEMDAKVAEIMKANDKLTYTEALKKAAKDNPALYERHRASVIAVN